MMTPVRRLRFQMPSGRSIPVGLDHGPSLQAAGAPQLWKRAHEILLAQAVSLQSQAHAGAPRRPRNSYQLWAAARGDEHSRVEDWSVWVTAERQRVIEWRELDTAERDRWVAAARVDRQRYLSEVRPWLRPTDDDTDLRLGCRRLTAYLQAERRRPEHPWGHLNKSARVEEQSMVSDAGGVAANLEPVEHSRRPSQRARPLLLPRWAIASLLLALLLANDSLRHMAAILVHDVVCHRDPLFYRLCHEHPTGLAFWDGARGFTAARPSVLVKLLRTWSPTGGLLEETQVVARAESS